MDTTKINVDFDWDSQHEEVSKSLDWRILDSGWHPSDFSDDQRNNLINAQVSRNFLVNKLAAATMQNAPTKLIQELYAEISEMDEILVPVFG